MEIKFKQQTAEHETTKKQLATFTQEKNDQSAIILAILKTMNSKIMTQQDASDEIKRLLVTKQQTITENLATSNEVKPEHSSLLTKLEKMETKMNEQDAEIKNLSHHMINILSESAGQFYFYFSLLCVALTYDCVFTRVAFGSSYGNETLE